MKRFACVIPLLAALSAFAAEPDPTRVLPPGSLPDDSRLGKPRDLYKSYFPMTPPASKKSWEERRQALRERVLVAAGLWPLPEKTPLRPVIHGKIDRDEYTIEKVFFASHPGHYVCGNLYRPKGRDGKVAGVLCPHGHWQNGRFYDAGEAEAKKQIAQGAEKTLAGAHYPLQARCAQLARMGCVVFHYDMVGVADSRPIPHRQGFTDAEAELRQQSFMGLQTWNSVRALDFLLALPEVDPKRIGVTGASGGGTQTFMLCAVDDRPTVAFPAVMVSTAMQGGCICENCSYLRIGAGNIDLAGLFAPKPLGMSGANDWTIDIETKGLPELKKLYGLYEAEDKVMAKCFPQFGHNYNQVSRELMYNWFNKHLQLGQPEPVVEKPFEPVPPKELSVYDAEHPEPTDAANAERLRQYLTEVSDRQLAALTPKNAKGLEDYRRVIGTALRVMIGVDSGAVTPDPKGISTVQSSTTVTITDEGVNKSTSTVTIERTAKIGKMLLTAG
jgi:dienelactone hydrolase